MTSNWEIVRLGDVTTQVRKSFKVEPSKSYVSLGLRMYGNGVFARDSKLGSEIKGSTLYQVTAGQFIYNRMFAAGGSFGLVSEELAHGVVSNEFPTFDVHEDRLLASYLELVFSLPQTWAQVEVECTGTTKSRLRWKESSFANFRVNLPPLAEQRRIVDLIGSLDDAIEAGAEGVNQSRNFLNALAEEQISRRQWNTAKVSDVAVERGLVGGPFGSSLVAKDYTESGVPVIRGKNMPFTGFEVSGEFVFVSQEKANSLQRNLAVPGDVMFTQRGTLGQVGLVPQGSFDRYVVSQSQMRLRTDPDVASPEFIVHAFRTPLMVSHIQSLNTATANPHINLGILKEIQIPIPPLDEQLAIAELLNSVVEDAEVATAHAESLRKLRSELLTSLLSGTHIIPESYDDVMTVAEGLVTA